ncbi:hypothetical protein GCM10020000_35580 [Streptomyces olivoverticillatus]
MAPEPPAAQDVRYWARKQGLAVHEGRVQRADPVDGAAECGELYGGAAAAALAAEALQLVEERPYARRVQ